MRLLVGLQNIAAPDLRVDVVNTDVPEIPLEIKRRRGLPELENHVDAFNSHQAQDRGIRGQVKEAEVALNAALAKAAHQAPARQMVEIGQTHGNVGGMVKRHKRYAGAKADLFGAGQGVGNKEIVGGDRLPLHRMVLPDPGFAVAQLISQDDEFQVFFKTGGAILLRRVHRHHKKSQVHGSASLCGKGLLLRLDVTANQWGFAN